MTAIRADGAKRGGRGCSLGDDPAIYEALTSVSRGRDGEMRSGG